MNGSARRPLKEKTVPDTFYGMDADHRGAARMVIRLWSRALCGVGAGRKAAANQRMKLTGAAILVSRGVKVLQAAPAAYPYRSAAKNDNSSVRIVTNEFRNMWICIQHIDFCHWGR